MPLNTPAFRGIACVSGSSTRCGRQQFWARVLGDKMRKVPHDWLLVVAMVAVVFACMSDAAAGAPSAALTPDVLRSGPILVVGSINMDTIIDVQRLPKEGETITTRSSDTGHSVPGGKGANQA
eukprot:2819664-Pyramimonas_sp.AAC.1